MAKEQLRYDRMVENALRGVVREALNVASERGLPGNHHFYISFRTNHPAVIIPDYLRAQYPGEMTIVLQYQFFGLDVEEDKFSVTLSFNNVHERLIVPYIAVTTFADPSVNFALQFQPVPGAETIRPTEVADASVPDDRARKPAATEDRRGEVVALDAFRKK